MKKEVISGDLTQDIQQAGAPLLKAVQLFDVYEGDRIEEGKKSLAFSLLYLDPEKTLTDQEVQEVHDRIVKTLEEKWEAQLRK